MDIDNSNVNHTERPEKANLDDVTFKVKKSIDLDDVLINELGQFGWFQFRLIVLLAVPLMMSAFINEYVFSAVAVSHRCRIPECGESNKSHQIYPEWIQNAIPNTLTGVSSCKRFKFQYIDSDATGDENFCKPSLFNRSQIISCDAGYVYESTNSVVYDFNLGCQDWLRALAGTLNSIGTLLVLPLTGYISDRYGRRLVLILNIFNLGLFGLMRAFSVNYTMYLILQIVQTTLGSGTVSAGYILAAELIGPKYRVLGVATLSSMFATGQIIMAGVAWLTPSWRTMLMVINIPCLFIISYFWLLSESIRWLLSKSKYEKARKILKSVARVNGTQISDKSMEALMNPQLPTTPLQNVKKGMVSSILHSKILLRRICTTPVWWITACFVYYGLSINSTSLSETKYLNYILTCAIEIPGFLTAPLLLDRIGRRTTLSYCFFFGAVCNIAFILIPSYLFVLRLIIYLGGKFSISTSMTALYVYTSELYPTEYRHSLLAFSSMIGRIGSITAPLTPVLINYWYGIPSLMFAAMGIISGSLVLTQPETMGAKLPDTMAEAEAVGQQSKSGLS